MGNHSLGTGNSLIVSDFQRDLLEQLVVMLVVIGAAALVWNFYRSWQFRHTLATAGPEYVPPVATPWPEPPARRLLRVAFGIIWLFDGLLQAQAAMPVGLANQVTVPAASGSPSWVVRLVNDAANVWNAHPITAAAAAVWVQVGIGVWLLVSARGGWSRAAGVVSVGWGLVVWAGGEAFGGIFAPGGTFLFGAPGAVLFYCVAGGLVALPDRVWSTGRLGTWLLRGLGGFLLVMATWQAWPGRGFWQGQLPHHATGSLTAMVESMVSTPQPSVLSSWVSDFASFDAAHGFGVNLVVVILLAAIGTGCLLARGTLLRATVVLAVLFCVADWVLIEDFGFFGGLGTDPNSMIPFALLVVAGYLAFTRPRTVPEPARVSWRHVLRDQPAVALRTLVALGAVFVTAFGAVPFAAAAANPNADPLITVATNGAAQWVKVPFQPFHLEDENGAPVTLASWSGKAVALTFLDPVCTTDCPIIAQEFKAADEILGSASAHVEFVIVCANQLYRAPFYLRAFDRANGLSDLKNYEYLTGSLAQLDRLWAYYSIDPKILGGGAMIDHGELAFLIDAHGNLRVLESDDPNAATTVTESSFADLLDQQLRRILP